MGDAGPIGTAAVTMEYEHEPIPGLPGRLPPGEEIVWQGSPDWRALARSVFRTRLVAAWFVIVAASAFVAGGTGLVGALTTMAVAVLGLGILAVLARAQARATIYTLTNRRVVMRIGVAVPKCINLPLQRIGKADARPAGTAPDGAKLVDISLTPTMRFPMGWLQIWPHVRTWKFGQPQPMLRAVPESFVPVLARHLASADPALPDAAVAPAAAGAPLGAAA